MMLRIRIRPYLFSRRYPSVKTRYQHIWHSVSPRVPFLPKFTLQRCILFGDPRQQSDNNKRHRRSIGHAKYSPRCAPLEHALHEPRSRAPVVAKETEIREHGASVARMADVDIRTSRDELVALRNARLECEVFSQGTVALKANDCAAGYQGGSERQQWSETDGGKVAAQSEGGYNWLRWNRCRRELRDE